MASPASDCTTGFSAVAAIRRCETKLTYPPVAYPVPYFRSPISPQDQDPGYCWTSEGSSIGRSITLTPIEESGQMHPSRLNSDVFWT